MVTKTTSKVDEPNEGSSLTVQKDGQNSHENGTNPSNTQFNSDTIQTVNLLENALYQQVYKEQDEAVKPLAENQIEDQNQAKVETQIEAPVVTRIEA